MFDLEFGQPAASSSLPNVKTQSNFKDILGCYGHASCGRTLAEGGLDILLCSHQVNYFFVSLITAALMNVFAATTWKS